MPPHATAPTALDPDAPADQAIPALLEAHGGKIYGLASRLCNNPHQAEDLVQEVFLQAYRKWDQFEGRADPATWLYTIAARLCYRMHRKRSGEPKRLVSLEDLAAMKDGPVLDLPGDHDGPLHDQLRAEARQQIEHAIVDLPAPARMPLILKEIIGFSVADVAQILGLKQSTVKTRLHRARHALRDALTERLPMRDAPPPAYAKRVCMDLLRAKHEALDRGAEFPMPAKDFCERCRAVFNELDLAHEVCERLGEQELPATLRRTVLDDIAAESQR